MRESDGQPEGLITARNIIPRLATFADAARDLGFKTGDALRRAFARKVLPKRFLIRLGKRTIRVDVEALVAFLRDSATAAERARDEAGVRGANGVL